VEPRRHSPKVLLQLLLAEPTPAGWDKESFVDYIHRLIKRLSGERIVSTIGLERRQLREIVERYYEPVLAAVPCQSATKVGDNVYRLPCSGYFDLTQHYSGNNPIETYAGRTGFKNFFTSGASIGAVAYIAPSQDSGAPHYSVTSTSHVDLPENFAVSFWARLKAGDLTSEGGIFVGAYNKSGGYVAEDVGINITLSRDATSYVKSATITVRSLEGGFASYSNSSIADTVWPDADEWGFVRAECMRSEKKLRLFLNNTMVFEYDWSEAGSQLSSDQTVRFYAGVGLICGLGGSLSNAAYNATISDFKIIELS